MGSARASKKRDDGQSHLREVGIIAYFRAAVKMVCDFLHLPRCEPFRQKLYGIYRRPVR